MGAGAPRRHFSMLRDFHLADLFTFANGFCGVAAPFPAMRFLSSAHRRAPHQAAAPSPARAYGRSLYGGAALVPLALVFDVLAGRVARWRHATSPMGRELDSL